MSKKSKLIEQFLVTLNEDNCNKISADNGLDEAFGKDKLFSVMCNKCRSLDVEIIGERGINWGGQTGYQEGSTVIKCNKCGSALTIWR